MWNCEYIIILYMWPALGKRHLIVKKMFVRHVEFNLLYLKNWSYYESFESSREKLRSLSIVYNWNCNYNFQQCAFFAESVTYIMYDQSFPMLYNNYIIICATVYHCWVYRVYWVYAESVTYIMYDQSFPVLYNNYIIICATVYHCWVYRYAPNWP